MPSSPTPNGTGAQDDNAQDDKDPCAVRRGRRRNAPEVLLGRPQELERSPAITNRSDRPRGASRVTEPPPGSFEPWVRSTRSGARPTVRDEPVAQQTIDVPSRPRQARQRPPQRRRPTSYSLFLRSAAIRGCCGGALVFFLSNRAAGFYAPRSTTRSAFAPPTGTATATANSAARRWLDLLDTPLATNKAAPRGVGLPRRRGVPAAIAPSGTILSAAAAAPESGGDAEVARRLGRAFVESILKDAEPIPGSDGMSVLRDVVQLEVGTRAVIVVRKLTCPFWQACIDTTETPGRRYRVCAVGTPGIGKTSATPLLIKMLLERRKTVVYLVSTEKQIGWYYEFIPGPRAGDPVRVNVYSEQTAVTNITTLKDPSTYYVVDPGDTSGSCNPPPIFQPKVIIVTSPDSRHWGGNKFIKERWNVRGKFKIFPVWELEELLRARPYLGKDLEPLDVERRYYEVGGVPRHVFEDSESYDEIVQEQNTALKLLSKEQRDRMITQGVDSVETFDESQPQSAIIAFRVGDDDDGTFSRYRVTFLGPRVEGSLRKRSIARNAASEPADEPEVEAGPSG